MKKISFKTTLVISTAVFFCSVVSLAFLNIGRTNSLSGSQWKAGRIIDDAIFFNPNTMSATDIQNFLNAKVPVCDTNGTQPYGGTTRASYSISKGHPPPFICLKNFSQNVPAMAADAYCSSSISAGTKSAAQIIKDVSVACSVNPQVLIVLLQKEQTLVTDDWPWPIQYTAATGFGCPDTSSCDPSFSGFFNQVYYGARQYQRYAKQPGNYNFRGGQTANIYYNPSATCGYGSVYLQNQATAGLYNYTPYQPNQAALNNLYGTGNSCSAYGNRNFWVLFNNWFGPTTNDSSTWGLIQDPNANKLYLVVGRTYYWIPGPSVEAAWGLDKYPWLNSDPNMDPTAYLHSLSHGPDLGYVALDSNATRYLMDNGKKYRLSDDAHVLAWGMGGDAAKGIYAVGLLGLTPSGGDAGRFGVSATDGTIYLLNGSYKHLGVNSQSLSYWGYSSSNATTVTDDILNRLPNGPAVDRYVRVSGQDVIVDKGRILRFKNAAVEDAWGDNAYVSIPSYATALLSSSTVGTFMRADNDARWYYLESGNKHYVSSSSYANIWGWSTSNPLTVTSTDLSSSFTTGANVGYLAYSSTTGKHYLIDGSKHWIPGPSVAPLWEGEQSVPAFSDSSLSLLPNGSNASSDVVGFAGHSEIYALDNGTLRYIPNYNVLDAFGAFRNNVILTAGSSLFSLVPRGTNADLVIKDGSGNAYYLENGYRFSINPSFYGTWRATNAPVFDVATLGSFTDTGKTVGETVSVGGKRYLVDNRGLVNVTSDYTNYGLSSGDFIPVSRTYFPIVASSHLVGTPGNNKIWLLSMGHRYYIPNYSLLSDLGYGINAGITGLHAEIIATLPEDSSNASRLIKAPDSGVIFAVRGKGFGFRDSATLGAYLGSNTTLVEPSSVFQKFTFSGWTSRIVYGTDGKIYYISGGQKQWIANPSLLWTRYAGISWWQLPQATIDAFPTGSTIVN
jgi:hypothetical protein